MTTQHPSALTMLLSRHTRRRELITLLGGAASWPLAARAQQSMPVVGYFSARSPVTDVPMLSAFQQGLNETGYVEGQNSRSSSDGRKAAPIAYRNWLTTLFV